MTVTETCLELKNYYGLNVSKEYDLDPDGLNQGQLPIRAWCDLPSGITKIGQKLEIDILHCNSSDCFTHDIGYEPQVMEQIKTLIQTSGICYQEITFHCFITPLIAPVRFLNDLHSQGHL